MLETGLALGAPLSLAVHELFHPHPHDLFHLDLRIWLLVHYLQLPLFPLAALTTIGLVRGRSGFAVAMCRVGMFVFAVTYTAFDTAAGVVTGVLLKAAQATSTPMAWRAPGMEFVVVVWNHPIIGGAPETVPLFAVLGTVAWLVGTLAAAIAVRRAGCSWTPVVLLVVSALGLLVFKTHARPGGPVTFGSLAAAAAWLQWERAARAKRGVERMTSSEGGILSSPRPSRIRQQDPLIVGPWSGAKQPTSSLSHPHRRF
jgi:hypothetical protein